MSKKLIKTAREWIGTPRHDGQAIKQVGCDCVGFLIGVAKETGYLPENTVIPNYSQIARENSLIKYLDQYLDRDLFGVIAALKYSEQITHIGIIDGYNLIHSHHKMGVISVTLTDYLKAKIVETYSLRT